MIKVWCQFQAPGIHYWKDADNYLQHPHRHMFHFRAEVEVTEEDREIEFIEMKEKAERYIRGYVLLDGMAPVQSSCEMLARETIDFLRSLYGKRHYCVSVSEDGENGATVELEA